MAVPVKCTISKQLLKVYNTASVNQVVKRWLFNNKKYIKIIDIITQIIS